MNDERLYMGGFDGDTEDSIREWIVREMREPRNVVDQYDVLVASCDSDCSSESAAFVLRRKSDGALFEVVASHCSCHGFEDCFAPEPTTLEYLASPLFSSQYYGCCYYLSKEDAAAAVNAWAKRQMRPVTEVIR